MTETSLPVPAEAEELTAPPESIPSGPALAAVAETATPPPADPDLFGEKRLDPRFVPFQRIAGWISTAVLSVGGLVAVLVLWLTAEMSRSASLFLLLAWAVGTVAIAWLLYAWPAVHYRHMSYRLDAEGIEIRSGVWWRAIMSVPRSRVQHIDVSQGPLERSYGLGRLVLFTAGTSHSRVELPGLSHTVALSLRNHLLPRGTDDAV
jgi:membrane protein YdbS with pleckstrin-like domain